MNNGGYERLPNNLENLCSKIEGIMITSLKLDILLTMVGLMATDGHNAMMLINIQTYTGA